MTEHQPMKLISRQQPHIETLQVSVHVIRVGPKQMTQAVYRQLKKERLVDPRTGALNGIPWGTVNYVWSDCMFPPACRHLHVVWQKGAALRRCCFPVEWEEGYRHTMIVMEMTPAAISAMPLIWAERVEEIETLPQLFIAV